jgi:hypothetical protein
MRRRLTIMVRPPTTAQRMGPIREIASESGTASNTLTCPAWGAAEKSAALLV